LKSVSRSFRSLALIGMAFLLWGLLRSLNDVIVPVFQSAQRLNFLKAMLVHLSFFSAYIFASWPSGRLVERRGYRTALVTAALLMACGSAIFVFVAHYRSFSAALAGILIFGAGITLLQVAANPWITWLQEGRAATPRLLLVQTFNSAGSIAGPVVGRAMLPAHGNAVLALAADFPSRPIAIIYGACAVVLIANALSLRLWFAETASTVPKAASIAWRALLKHKPALAGFATIFLAVGAEAAVLGHAIRYLSSPRGSGISPRVAALLLAGYWAAVMAGRLAGALLLRKCGARMLLSLTASCAFVLLFAALESSGRFAGFALLSTGFFNSVIFPAVFTRTVLGLPKPQAPALSGLLTMAIGGGALLPLLSGALADRFGVQAALLPPLASYVCIAIYALTLAS
jgi:MFS transporter, FHS family, L-fucose permease